MKCSSGLFKAHEENECYCWKRMWCVMWKRREEKRKNEEGKGERGKSIQSVGSSSIRAFREGREASVIAIQIAVAHRYRRWEGTYRASGHGFQRAHCEARAVHRSAKGSES